MAIDEKKLAEALVDAQELIADLKAELEKARAENPALASQIDKALAVLSTGTSGLMSIEGALGLLGEIVRDAVSSQPGYDPDHAGGA